MRSYSEIQTRMKPEKYYSNLIEKIKKAGLRPTRQRIALAKLLFGSGERHVTAEILYKEVLQTKMPISIATIYNTLNKFTDVHLLKEVAVDSQRSYFDTNIEEHYHFFYKDDNFLEDIPLKKIKLLNLPVLPEGTKIDSVNIIIKLKNKTL